MNFSSKIAQLLIGGTIGSMVALNLLPVSVASNPTASQLAQALNPEEVNLRAKQIIVRIDGANQGSGSLIGQSGNTYTVLTNWHVVKDGGDYTIQTIDGRKHQVDSASIERLPGLDLAIFKFNSSQNYQVAELGDANNLSEGQTVYFAGYPGELRQEDNRYYRFFTANLVGILPKATENGYSLVYSGEAFPGMSGGPVLNKQGLMIGIHGEANIHAVSGGTSNYGIAINSYQQAIAQGNTQPTSEPQPAETETAEATPPSEAASPPEVIVNTTPQPEAEPESSPSLSDNISSVPTFTPDTSANTPETTATQQPSETASDTDRPTAATQPEVEETKQPVTVDENSLVSARTGIDYTKLRNLLEAKKWSEADLHTYQLIEQIVKSAKQQNKHVFIELKTIANFSCPDVRTIDALWKKYSDNKFGFSPQQKVWQNVNQQGDFSTQTWRRFATKVGWKQGEVASSSGYKLYEQLDFEPAKAPVGHLPWWFALPDEEQKVIKSLFSRCNLNPTLEELEAEATSNINRDSTDNGNEIDKTPDTN